MTDICKVRFPMWDIDCVADELVDQISSGKIVNFPEGTDIDDWKGITSVIAENYINRSLNVRILQPIEPRTLELPDALAKTKLYAVKFDRLEPQKIESNGKCYKFNLWINAARDFLEYLKALHEKNKWHMFDDMTRRCPENFLRQNFMKDFAGSMEIASLVSKGDNKYLDKVWDASLNLLFGRENDELDYAEVALLEIIKDHAGDLARYVTPPYNDDDDERTLEQRVRDRMRRYY